MKQLTRSCYLLILRNLAISAYWSIRLAAFAVRDRVFLRSLGVIPKLRVVRSRMQFRRSIIRVVLSIWTGQSMTAGCLIGKCRWLVQEGVKLKYGLNPVVRSSAELM